jgi:putative glycosyltransferase
MQLSVVATLYASAPYLEEFYRRASAAAQEVTDDYEIVLVNDGSPDTALDVAVDIHRRDSHVRVVDLSRNFGHHKAMMAGLAHAKGAYVFLIDCDLEEAPEVLPAFYRRLHETTSDVVYGVQATRKGAWFERVSGAAFYRLFNQLSTDPIPANQTVARLMTRRYVDALLLHHEREFIIAGLWARTGFRQVPETVVKQSKGTTTYSFLRRINMFLDAVTSFSSKPLVWMFYLGLLILLVSSGAAIWLIARRLFFGVYLSGWPSLVVSIWLLGGLTIFCLGLIGIYLSKIFMEVKQRPSTIVRVVYEGEGRELP